MTRAQILGFLRQTHLFKDVAEEALLLVVRKVKENFFARGYVIFNEGDSGETIHIVAQGKVKIVKNTKEGKAKTLAILKEGENFGEMALLTKDARTATVEAIEETSTLSITREDFEYLVKKEPSISFQIIKTLCERLARADRDIKNLALGDARSRIACVLADLQKEMKVLKLTHQDIAELAGLTRETTTRTLIQLEKEGVVQTASKSITITDIKKLNEYCI